LKSSKFIQYIVHEVYFPSISTSSYNDQIDHGGRVSPFSTTRDYQNKSKSKKASKSPVGNNNSRSLSAGSDNMTKRTESSVIEPPKSHRAISELYLIFNENDEY